MPLLEYALMDFNDIWIQWSSGRGTIGVFRILGSKSSRGHLGSLFKYAQNASSSTWFDRFWWNLGEEILDQRFFRGVQEFLIGGHLGSFGVTVEGQILNSLLQQIWLCQCVGLGQPSKSVHGDLFTGGVLRFELDRGMPLGPQNPYPRVILAEKGTHF